MTTEEAIKILEIMAIDMTGQLAATRLASPMVDVISRRMDAIDIAQDALRAQQERENPKPLTLDELRTLDEVPVYIRMGDGREGYAIIYWDCGSAILCGPEYDEAVTGEPDVDFYGLSFPNDPNGYWGLHQLGWLAYRREPSSGDNGVRVWEEV